MKYYQLNLRPREHPEYCFLHSGPEELGLSSWRLMEGAEFGETWPSNASLHMGPDEPGLVLPSLVGNTNSMIVVSTHVKECVQRVNSGPTEYLPVAIYNQQKQLVSDAYFIVNPIGTYDCLNAGASDIVYYKGKVVKVKKPVFDPARLTAVPALFRITEQPRNYFISGDLTTAISQLEPKPSNFYLFPIDLLPVEQGA